MSKKEKEISSKSVFYQELSEEITNTLPNSPADVNIDSFLNNTLPISESTNAVRNLRSHVGVSLYAEVLKKTRPFKRKCGLSKKERRAVGLYRLPKFNITYNEALPMLRFWQNYMYRFLNLNQEQQNKRWYDPKSGHLWDTMSVILMKADYHGALLKVVNSKCHSLVGLQGIVIFDTKFTFTIVGKDDISRTLPKQSCIFEIYLKKYVFKIFGKYFCIRSNERSSKKIKSSLIPIL